MKVKTVGVDLIAKEFQKHEKCFRDYTRIVWSDLKVPAEPVYIPGDYEAVCNIIDNEVITLQMYIFSNINERYWYWWERTAKIV